ncbi:MAG: hypothetical protein PF441_01460 [Desulfuromusa sp.]|jgi:hypothetical protein|nr:hypothetical protein [Desulfuromusa sp.]
MVIGDLVGFKKELFFEGAVQLRWAQENPERAKVASENFVFHGPRYHGVSENDDKGVSRSYKLTDTATFIHDLINSLCLSPDTLNINPLLLAVAGYGSGKSHFALTASQLLSQPNSPEALCILKNIYAADAEIGNNVAELLEKLKKPALVVTLDGMSNFHLGSELSRGIIRQLKNANVDLDPITELSPRFQYAEDFVIRNYEFRKNEFDKAGINEALITIIDKLQEQDEDLYSIVDDVFFKANGTRIPVDGHESAQDLIKTVCEVYCGPAGHFSGLVILFDEFGRYLEYAAEKPNLAGDSALQQIFQGIQDCSDKARFVGFIQYELKAYLNRFNQRDLLQLQRYITRFDSSEKLYLSTNLETLFAHLIEKHDEEKLSHALETYQPKGGWAEIHSLFCSSLPGFKRIPVWSDFEKFKQVVVNGCWPLHPLTTWFLTRQQDIVQSRSALTFIKDAVENVAFNPHQIDGDLYYISPAELVLQSMLPEIIAAERTQGGSIAETLQAVLEKYKSKLTPEQKLLLAGVMILDKLRIETREKLFVDKLLGFVSGLSDEILNTTLSSLSNEVGVVEWNADLGQYELIADAATRGQFQVLLNKKLREIDRKKISEIFIHRGSNYAELTDINPDFSNKKNISTSDWFYESSLADAANISGVLKGAIENWKTASSHDDPKGHVVYVLVQEDEDYDAVACAISAAYKRNLDEQKAPIWSIVLHDRDGKICESLARAYVVDEEFGADEQDKFRRFIPEEQKRALRALKDGVQKSQLERNYYVAGIEDVPEKRLNAVASWLFEQVYPKVISFPFDGFGSKSGAGPRDCMSLMRALVGRQVNGDWVALQQKAMQNRVRRLLVQDWKVLGTDGKLRQKPEEEPLAEVLQVVENAHLEDSGRTLGETFKMLLSPPYGFNASSAGVILGLMLAKELPPRALKLNGDSCSLEEWLVHVLPNKKGKYSFDIQGLAKTNLLFLEEDANQRWNSILIKIEDEKNLSQKILLFKAAEKQRKADPLPESLEGMFSYVRDKALEAELTVGKHYKELEELEKSFERAERQRNVDSLIYCGSKFAQKISKMEGESELWADSQIHELTALVSHVNSLLSVSLAEWISSQSCNNIKQVSVFREKMENRIRGLETLGLEDEATCLDEQKNTIIYQIDKRAEYEMSLNKATDIVRLPEPTLKDKVLSLRHHIKEVDGLVVTLTAAYKKIDAKDISDLIVKLKSRKHIYADIESQHKKRLGEVYNYHIDGLQAVENLLVFVKDLQHIFSGTKDENDVVEVFEQLMIFKKDMQRWESLEIPPEELEILLEEQVDHRIQEIIRQVESADGELFCDLEEVYVEFKNNILKDKMELSTQWLRDISPKLDELDSWSVPECERQLSKLNNVPTWISLVDRNEITRFVDLIFASIKQSVENERQKKEITWLTKVRDEIPFIATRSVVHCEKLVSELSSVPEYIHHENYDEVSKMRKTVQSHIDGMHIDDIYERICNLSESLRISLIRQLKRKFSEMFSSE